MARFGGFRLANRAAPRQARWRLISPTRLHLVVSRVAGARGVLRISCLSASGRFRDLRHFDREQANRQMPARLRPAAALLLILAARRAAADRVQKFYAVSLHSDTEERIEITHDNQVVQFEHSRFAARCGHTPHTVQAHHRVGAQDL